jgi:hypothetical protein
MIQMYKGVGAPGGREIYIAVNRSFGLMYDEYVSENTEAWAQPDFSLSYVDECAFDESRLNGMFLVWERDD